MAAEKIPDKAQRYLKEKYRPYLAAFALSLVIGLSMSIQPVDQGKAVFEGAASGTDKFFDDLSKFSEIAASRHIPERQPEAERIIMIDVDTLGAGHIGAYGYEGNTTPFLDRFARRNTVFRNAVTPATWTRASQMSVFTGTYPRTHGFLLLRHKAPDEFNTMAEAFDKAGYRTAAFTGGKGMKDGLGFEQGFDNYTDHEEPGYVNMEDNLGRAFSFVNESGDSPSFTFVHGYDMHDPYGSTPEAKTYSVAGYETPIAKSRLFHENGTAYVTGENGTRMLDDQDIRNLRRAYDQDLRSVDRDLERFVQRLKENDLYEDSTIVIYSSHGENLADNVYKRPGSRDAAFGHLYLWPQTTQVPLMIKSPEMKQGEDSRPVSIMDIGPTLYDIADLDLDPRTSRQQEGESLLGYQEKDIGDPEFSETKHAENVAVNLGGYKFIQRKDREDVLYRYENGSFRELEKGRREALRRNLSVRIADWRNETPETYEEAVSPDYESGIFRSLISLSGMDLFPDAAKPLEMENLVVESSDSFRIRQEDTTRLESGDVSEITASTGEGRSLDIRIFHNRSSEFALDYISERRQEASSVYEGAEPYGFRSGAKGCDGEFQPEIEVYDEDNRVTIRFYEDSEGFRGACEEDAYRKVTVYMGYCSGSDTLYRIEDKMSDLGSSNRLGIGCD